MVCLSVGALIGVRGTSVTVAVRTTVLTLLGVVPTVVGAREDIVTNTLDRAIGTGRHTLTILTSARGATAVLRARPGVFGTIVFAVTAVVVRTTSVTVVVTKLTIITGTSLRVTSVGTTVGIRAISPLRIRAQSTAASELSRTVVLVIFATVLALTVSFVAVDITTIVTVVLLDLSAHTHDPFSAFTEGFPWVVRFAQVLTLLVGGTETWVQVGAITHESCGAMVGLSLGPVRAATGEVTNLTFRT